VPPDCVLGEGEQELAVGVVDPLAGEREGAFDEEARDRRRDADPRPVAMERDEVRDLAALDVLDLHVLARLELEGPRVGRPDPPLVARLTERGQCRLGLDGHAS
jgi:hypothetical protein